ncbi:DUF3068 domain-containing protein [Marmoricola sp. RAF53]|uniref:DUF3068 domain-containing protein n=1 Tax=Marmoricola sp. RAF53 TaxID=3233059 RepID=UPI003F9C3DBF
MLFGIGAFLITASLVLRFYGSAQLATAEKDPREVTTMQADDATVFVPSTQTEETTDVTVLQKTAGDLDAEKKAPSGVVVWFTTSTRKIADGTVVQQSMARTAMDASTAAARPCCESFAEVIDQAIAKDNRSGLVLKFPFGTEKRTYSIWDSTLGKPVKAVYRGNSDVDGVAVYRFEVKVPDTVIGSQEVIASTIGLKVDGTVPADRTYGVDRTLYVEPRTGAILNDVQDVRDTLTRDGQVVRTLFAGKLGYTDQQVRAKADKYGDRAETLQRVRVILPAIALVIGLVCIGGGVLAMRRSAAGSRRRDGQ